MRIAILGGPGSGKGTQAQMLAERYRVPQISTGELLREAVKNDKKWGQPIKETLDDGQLVDDAMVLNLLEERIRYRDTKRGFIIDGYPRSIPQAQALDTLLGLLGRTLQVAIYIRVDDDILAKRILGRLNCDNCGAIYNRYYVPPEKRGVCDHCGAAKLSPRTDDTPKTVQTRIEIFHEQTQPLITYYKAQHKLRTLTGDGDIEEIHSRLCDLIDIEIRPLEIHTLDTASAANEETDTTVIAGGQINRIKIESPKPVKKKPVVKKMTARKATAKKPVRKTASKKIAVKKKPVAKKVTAKKATAKKSVRKTASKKIAVKKKPVAKKVTARKATAKKPVRKTASKKIAVEKKPVAKKATARKATAKKPVRKTASKRVAVKKKPVTKKAAAKKATAKKSVRKTASKKIAVTKKPVVKKAAARKAAAKKSVRKTASKKVAVTKKTVVKKAPARKAVAKKSVRKTASKKIAVTKKPVAKKAVRKKTAKKKR